MITTKATVSLRSQALVNESAAKKLDKAGKRKAFFLRITCLCNLLYCDTRAESGFGQPHASTRSRRAMPARAPHTPLLFSPVAPS